MYVCIYYDIQASSYSAVRVLRHNWLRNVAATSTRQHKKHPEREELPSTEKRNLLGTFSNLLITLESKSMNGNIRCYVSHLGWGAGVCGEGAGPLEGGVLLGGRPGVTERPERAEPYASRKPYKAL